MVRINKLSLIVPVYNEIKTLPKVWQRLKQVKIVGTKLEIVWVDDGSIDGSVEFLKKIEKTKIRSLESKVIIKMANEGKGAAIKTGLAKVTGTYVIIQDADLEYDPKDIEKLVNLAEKQNLDVVFGSRDREVKNKYIYPHFYWGSRGLCLLLNLAFAQKYTDPETCYKLIRTKLFREMNISEKGFGMEIELAAKVAIKKLRFSEVGITYKPRSFEEGKKITTRDGIRAVYLIFKYWAQSWKE